MLVRIVGRSFVAGVVLDAGGVVREAAPLLRWMVGRAWPELRPILRRRRWQAAVVRP